MASASPVTLNGMKARFRPASCIFAVIFLVCVLSAQSGTQQPSPSSSKPASSAHGQPSAPDAGVIANGVYRNSFFGFSYKLPFGWVDRTEDMRGNPEQPAQPSANAAERPQAGAEAGAEPGAEAHPKPIVLLATFERPPEATGDTVNSAVVFAAEPVASYPGLRNPEHYFGPLTELTKSKDFTVVNEPYEFPVDAKPLVRGDFSKPRGKLTMYQSTLVMMQKGYVISFTFIGGSDEEVDELVEGLSFGQKAKPAGNK